MLVHDNAEVKLFSLLLTLSNQNTLQNHHDPTETLDGFSGVFQQRHQKLKMEIQGCVPTVTVLKNLFLNAEKT